MIICRTTDFEGNKDAYTVSFDIFTSKIGMKQSLIMTVDNNFKNYTRTYPNAGGCDAMDVSQGLLWVEFFFRHHFRHIEIKFATFKF